MHDKRKHPRVRPHALYPIEVQLVGNGFMDVLLARDISETGIGLEVPHRFAGCDLSGEVDLIVTLPGLGPVQAKGLVRHRSGGEASPFFGIEFTELPDDFRKLMVIYIAGRLRGGGLT